MVKTYSEQENGKDEATVKTTIKPGGNLAILDDDCLFDIKNPLQNSEHMH